MGKANFGDKVIGKAQKVILTLHNTTFLQLQLNNYFPGRW
jgi:hypothetical protein